MKDDKNMMYIQYKNYVIPDVYICHSFYIIVFSYFIVLFIIIIK